MAISKCLVVIEWQFHNETDVWLSRMTISHCYSHVGREWEFNMATDIYKNGHFTLLLVCSCQEWQFHNATDV